MRIRGSSPAVRVAAVATAAIAVVYVIGAIVLNLVVAQHMTQQNDDQLGDRLTVARHHPDTLRQRVAQGDASSDLDADGAPVFLWAVNSRRAVVAHSPGAPALPPALLTAGALRDGTAVTANLGGRAPFRLKVAHDHRGWLVAGQNLAERRAHPEPDDGRRDHRRSVPAARHVRWPAGGGPARAGPGRAVAPPPARVHRRRVARAAHPAERDQGRGRRGPVRPAGGRRIPRLAAPDPGREPPAAPAGGGHAVAGQVRLQAPAARQRAGRPGHARPGLRRPVPFRRPRGQRGDPGRCRADQRAAGVDRPAGRGARSTTPAGTRARTARSGSRSAPRAAGPA